VGRSWREDEIKPGETTIHRRRRAKVIGTVADYPTKKLALRELERLVKESSVNAPDYRPRPTARFEDFAARWVADVLSNHKPSTRSACASQIRTSIVPAFGKVAMKDIDAAMMQRFSSALARTKSPKTVRNHIAVLKMMWKQARAWAYVAKDSDPFQDIVLPKNGLDEQSCFTLDQMRAIITASEEPWQTFFWLAAETGLRIGELTALRIQHVDVLGCQVKVRQSCWRGQIQTTKSRRGVRTCVISPALARKLASQFQSGAVLVFETANRKPLDHGHVRRKLYAVLDPLGIPQAGMHAFRHGNETLMDRLNAPPKLRQQRLGHADERMMFNYSHVASQDEIDLSARLGEMLTPESFGLNVGLKPN
jgi:integrase